MKENDKSKNRYNEERYRSAVNVAADLFLRNGIDSVKMTDIAENSGLGVASLYRFFETKTEIVIRAGIILWQRIEDDFFVYVKKNKKKSGLMQLIYNLEYFKCMYVKHRDFIKFLDDFDRIMLSEKVPAAQLEDYEKSIVNFYDTISESCKKGWEDGTIRKDINLSLVYSAITHALMAVSQKFIRGGILPGDDFSGGEKEIDKILEMTAVYLAA